ncbi:Phosphopentomutase [compost metagenome]
MGHQEIMGTLPLPPVRMPFSTRLEKVEQALKNEGFKVERYPAHNSELRLLWANDAVSIGDNLEADLGQVFNVCGNLSAISFEQVEKIGRVVRSCVEVGRVIAYGGLLESSEQILAAVEVKDNRFIGINSPKAGVYRNGFQVIHLGYGVDASVQVPQQLYQQGILTVLVGKVADIVENPQGRNYQQLVDSQTILDITLDELQRPGPAFICTNIQETDLAGHAQDAERYAERLQLVDASLAKLISAMDGSDCLVVMADHGNDPTVGHSKHTREQVPLLIFRPGQAACSLGIRTTLSDVGATVCEFFNAKAPYNGRSFLAALNA